MPAPPPPSPIVGRERLDEEDEDERKDASHMHGAPAPTPIVDSAAAPNANAVRRYDYLRVQHRIVFETLADKTHSVVVLEAPLQETPAVSDPTIKVINLCSILEPGTCFFAFGRPNVYMGHISEDGTLPKLDAKSLRRAPNQITVTDGRAQSGIFLIPRNLPSEVFQRIQKLARDSVAASSKSATCVNANASILDRAGFRVGQERWRYRLSEYYLPSTLLRDVLHQKLYYEDQEIEFDILRTCPESLSQAFGAIGYATRITPLRHLTKYYNAYANLPEDLKQKRIDEAKAVEHSNRGLVRLHQRQENMKNERWFTVEVSRPSTIGACMRRLWKPHVITKIHLPRELVDQHLPNHLQAYPDPNPSWGTWIKHSVLFSKPSVNWLRSHMAPSFEPMQNVRAVDFIHMLDPGQYFNLVVTGDALIVSQLNAPGGYDLVDWILSKHVLTCGYSTDVRFAGELWRVGDSTTVVINSNSGTYKPSASQLHAAVALARELFDGFFVMSSTV